MAIYPGGCHGCCLAACLGCGKRPKVSSQATCLDLVEVAIHSYRHRYGAAESDPAFEPIEAELVKQPIITVPTIVLHGDIDGVSPPRSSERNCKACQRRTCTAFHFGASYPKERVRLDGEQKMYERDADSGNRIRFHFCPNCGTTLYWEGDRNPAVCGVAVGAFDTSAFPPPSDSIWEESMYPWLGLPSGTEHHRQGRPLVT